MYRKKTSNLNCAIPIALEGKCVVRLPNAVGHVTDLVSGEVVAEKTASEFMFKAKSTRWFFLSLGSGLNGFKVSSPTTVA